MLRHIVLVKFKPEATPAQLADWRAAIEGVCKSDPEVLSFTLGANCGTGPNHHDAAVVADFADMASFRRYIVGPAHQDYVKNHARNVTASLAAIQHEM